MNAINDKVVEGFDYINKYSKMITEAHKKKWNKKGDFPTSGYLLKMLEELGEVQKAINDASRDNALEETLDFIFTGFMMLDHLEITEKELREIVNFVVIKQERRIIKYLPKILQNDIEVLP